MLGFISGIFLGAVIGMLITALLKVNESEDN